jgi:phage tail sheath protein FI
MPEYLSPGVYIEEIDAGPKPIEGVSTSTAGAVGVTAFGPTTGKPELVTSFAEYQRKFGGFLEEPDAAIFNQWALNQAEGGRWWLFPLSVRGFFDNGGQRLYVKRVFASTAVASFLDLGTGLFTEVSADAPAGATELHVQSTIGINPGATVQIVRGDTGNLVGANFTVGTFNTVRGTIRIAPALPEDLLTRRGDFVQVAAQAAAPPASLTFRAKSRGSWGDDVRVRIRPMFGATLSILPDPNITTPVVATTVATIAAAGATTLAVVSVAGLANSDRVSLNNVPHTISNLNTGANTFDVAPPLAAAAAVGDAVTQLRSGSTTLAAAAPPGTTTLTVADATGFANGDRALISSREFQISNLNSGANTFDISPAVPQGQTLPVNTPVARVAVTLTTVAAIANAGATSITAADTRDLANGDHIVVNTREFIVSALHRPTNTFTIAPAVPGSWAVGLPIRRLRPAAAANSTTLVVRGADQLYDGALVELDSGSAKETASVASRLGETVTFGAALTNPYFEGHRLRVVEVEVSARYARADLLEPLDETFPNLRLVDDGSMSYLARQVNDRSALVNIEVGGALSTTDIRRFPTARSAGWQALANGDDRVADLSPDDFIGVDNGSGRRTGIQALEDIDDVSVCMVPNLWSGSVQSALIQHCEILQDRFAILDPRDGLSIEGIREFREPIDTKYAALYYPWIEVRDPSIRRNVILAPSGHMAGIYARVDVERGVHKAPANEVIRGITKIADDVTKREQDMLNPKGINALRFFPGRGNRVWGARTVSSDASWRYVNVRRLFIFIEESIDEGTQFVVFEPNDDKTWARVRQTVVNFLTTQWRNGALFGLTADEAFFVKCDRTTMTPDDIDNGKLIVIVGIAPVKPAEFVIFRIQQKTVEFRN